MSDTSVTLKTSAGDFDYPVLEGTVGPDGIFAISRCEAIIRCCGSVMSVLS